MQVTNNQPTTTNHPTGQAAEAGFGAVMTAEAKNSSALNPHQEALLNAALDNIAHQMEAHGQPALAQFARQTLENAARPVLADPNLPDEENLKIMEGHFLHHLLNRLKGFDPAAPMNGPIEIPQRDGNGALNIVAFDFPNSAKVQAAALEAASAPKPEPVEIAPEPGTGIPAPTPPNAISFATNLIMVSEQLRLSYGPRGSLTIGAQASQALREHMRDDAQAPHEHSQQNLTIARQYIPHLLAVDNGVIQDERFPQGGPYWIPYHLPTGELIQKPVELA